MSAGERVKRRRSLLRPLKSHDGKNKTKNKTQSTGGSVRDTLGAHMSRSVPLLLSEKADLEVDTTNLKKNNSEKTRTKRRKSQPTQHLTVQKLSVVADSSGSSNSKKGKYRPPERGKNSNNPSLLPSPRSPKRQPSEVDNLLGDTSDADTRPAGHLTESGSREVEDKKENQDVQNKLRLLREKALKLRQKKSKEDFGPLILLPLKLKVAEPEYATLIEAETAHYRQKHKSAALLYFFLRGYIVNFHLAYRLAMYYLSGIGGLEKSEEKFRQYIKEALATADQGDALSNYDLANIYEYGTGVEKDEEKSIKLYTLAAEQSCIKAQYNLGLIYSSRAHEAEQQEQVGDTKGTRITTRSQDEYTKAIKYFEMAAEKEFPGALCNLGVMYQLGEGVPVDYQRAIEYYTMAANNNYAVAYYNLGLIYESGLGDVPMNLSEAIRCYERASLSGHGNSEFSLAKMYKKGRGVPKDFSISLHYFQKAASHGCVRAYYYIGNMHRKGQGLPEKDKDTALHYYLKAADFQYNKAYNKIGLMYARGTNTLQKDYQKAVEFYKLGAEHGSSRAQYNLGVMYERGKGINKDPELAFHYFKLSAEQGYVKAQYNLGWMYQNGRGVPTDNQKALEYLEKAAEQKSPEALFYLGWMYFYGEGIEANKEIAMELWKLSSLYGYRKARTILEEMVGKGEIQ